MKSLLVFTLLAISLFAESPEVSTHDNPGLDMLLSTEIQFEELVILYDYQGNLVKELSLTDVVNNNISVLDHLLLADSDFAFDYLGDYYYFTEAKTSSLLN